MTIKQPKQVFLIIRNENGTNCRKVVKAFSTRAAANKLYEILRSCYNGSAVSFEIMSIDVED